MKIKKIIINLILLIIFSFTLLGCEGFWEAMTDVMLAPTGTVVDAKTGFGINGVTVKLHLLEADTGVVQADVVSVTTSTGSFAFSEKIKPGKYEVTATSEGYVFIPVITDITGWSVTLPVVYGIQPLKQTDVSIFLTWNTTVQDVDAYLTYPTGFETTKSAINSTFAAFPVNETIYSDGSFPNSTGSRVSVFYNNKQDYNSFGTLDVDITDGVGPETITIDGTKTGGVSGTAIVVNSLTPDNLGSGLSPGNYYWMGSADYYIKGPSENISNSGNANGANPVVYVTQGESVIGRYEVPKYVEINTLALFRIHLFYNSDNTLFYLVFYPYGYTSSPKGETLAGPLLVVSGNK